MNYFRQRLILVAMYNFTKDLLRFTALQDNSTVSLSQIGTPTSKSADKVIKYSLNGIYWNTYTLGDKITLNMGEMVYWKSEDELPMGESSSIYKKFVMTGSLSASGSVQSLFNDSDSVPAYGCYNMFYGCTSLTQAPELPATTLTDYCYGSMFYGCTSLTQAPELPATTLETQCYYQMFRGCTGLTQAPELPVTTLVSSCYCGMFQGCTGLTQAPELPATTLASSCYLGMFLSCTSLTQAPELPATTLIDDCYTYLFQNCSKLNYIKAMFTTEPSTTYTNKWVSGVASSGTFVKNSAATWDVTGVYGVPSGWTVKTEEP